MARKARPDEQAPVTVRPVIDPLDMTLREFLAALVEARMTAPANDADEWIDIRGDRYPWRHIVDSAEQGECEVARVGRRLMMRRQELSRWLSSRRISTATAREEEKPDEPLSEEQELRQQARASLQRAGFRRR
jgi:hypothetical protein